MFGKNEKKIKVVILTISFSLFAGLFFLARQGENASFFSEEMPRFVEYVPGRVVGYDLLPPTDHTEFYTQHLHVELLAGSVEIEHASGETESVSLTGIVSGIDHVLRSPRFPRYEVGDALVILLNTATDTMMVYNPNRSNVLIGFGALFLILLFVIGGKRGLLSVIGLVFSLLLIVSVLVPLTLQGYSSIAVAFVIAILIILVSITLLAGVNAKSLSAIAGCIFGVLSAAVLAAVAGHLAQISGYHTEEFGQLIFLEEVRVSGIFVGGVIVSALGAITDTAMTIASSMEEVKKAQPAIKQADLFKAGLNVGRDAMGTMSNTLILAFVGSSLGLLLVVFASEVTFLQFINNNAIGIEIIQSIAGSIGIILTVPFTTFIAAKCFTFDTTHKQEKKQ